MRGGARAGAGRKDIGDRKKITVACRVTAQTKERLYTEAQRLGISVGELIELLINKGSA